MTLSDTSGRPARIALYAGGGAPFHHAAVFARAGHEISFVFPADIVSGALRGFDAFVMPGGGYEAMIGQLKPLGSKGASVIRSFVERGGMYLGSCAGSYSAVVVPQVFRDACPAQEDLCLLDASVWNDGTRSEWVGLEPPGIGVLAVRNVASDHPVMAGMPEQFDITHYNGPFFRGGTSLAVVAGAGEAFTPCERYLGGDEEAKLLNRAVNEGVADIVVGSRGAGRVVLFGSHPEFGTTLPMDDEPAAARMLRNAVDWQLSETKVPPLPAVRLATSRVPSTPVPADQIERFAQRLIERCAQLRRMPGTPSWIAEEHAISFFGRSPQEIWSSGLATIENHCTALADRAATVRPEILGFRQPHEWDLDGGFDGVAALLEQADQMLATTIETWEFRPDGPTIHPYQHMRTSPYHLAVGSYLSAAGRVVAATLLCDAQHRIRL